MAQSKRPEDRPEPKSDELKTPLEEFLDATRNPINSSDLFRSAADDQRLSRIEGSDRPRTLDASTETVLIAAVYAVALVALFAAAYLFASII